MYYGGCAHSIRGGQIDIPSVYASGAAETSESQYIAIGVVTTGGKINDYTTADNYIKGDEFNSETTYIKDIDGHTYIYTAGYDENGDPVLNDDGSQKYYWVREGYSIKIITDAERFEGAATDTIIDVYKLDSDADSNGLLQSYQNVISNTDITTLNGKTLQDSETGVYGGAVNTSTFQVNSTGDFYIDDGTGTYIDVKGQLDDYFITLDDNNGLTYDETTGMYSYNGQVVASNNLYVINDVNDNNTSKVGVFVINGELYTGSVFGKNNEILMTAVDEDGSYASYWGAEIVDPNTTIGGMTISTLQEKFDLVNENIEKIHEDDIKEIQVGANQDGNGGTIGLLTNGAFDENGNPTGGASISGAITVTSTGGTDGEDVAIEFSNDNGSFTVDAGSKVKAVTVTSSEESNELTGLIINGKEYSINTNTVIIEGMDTVDFSEGKNITIAPLDEDDDENVYTISLNDEITLGDKDGNNVFISGPDGEISVTNAVDGTKTTINGGNITATGNITAGSFTSGDISINADNSGTVNGLTNKTWDGVNYVSGQAATEDQLYGVQQQVNNNSTAINNLGNRVSSLSNRIDKVGAGAAALAALHPLDFDPDDKLSFAAGYGNYAGENAVAVGAFYQPDEDTMFSVGGAFGNDENMVNAGVSFKLGRKNNVSRSRVSMAKELVSLRDEVAQLKALMAHSGVLPADGQLDTSALFPDIPENHWAYEYVHELARIGVVEGYPDGNFEGDRMMTRYELAAVVYRAMQKGVNVDRRMLSEFEPELKLIRVDVVAKDKNGNPAIERVRVNEDAQRA